MSKISHKKIHKCVLQILEFEKVVLITAVTKEVLLHYRVFQFESWTSLKFVKKLILKEICLRFVLLGYRDTDD